jgi:hypothetical protein
MELWKKVWRDGLAPLLSAAELEVLRRALVRDDARLVQHATCSPPPSEIFHEEAVEGACAIGFCGWHANEFQSVGEVEAFFIRTCSAADEALGEPGAWRHFLNWFFETHRDDIRRQLLQELNRALYECQSIAA